MPSHKRSDKQANELAAKLVREGKRREAAQILATTSLRNKTDFVNRMEKAKRILKK